MTKAEIIKALENINDNEEVTFLYTTTDRDGWLDERVARVERIEATNAYNARIHTKEVNGWKDTLAAAEKRIERLTAEMEDAPTKAAAKRNTERAELIAWYKEVIENLREKLAKN